MSESRILVILDNTVLTNFARVRSANLLFALWSGMVCTTPAAIAEYDVASAKGILPADIWRDLNILVLSEDEMKLASELTPDRLGSGERTCLATAILRQGMFASDDLVARRSAFQHGVAITGSLGVLIACVQRGLLLYSEGNRILAEMIAAGYHSPVSRLPS